MMVAAAQMVSPQCWYCTTWQRKGASLLPRSARSPCCHCHRWLTQAGDGLSFAAFSAALMPLRAGSIATGASDSSARCQTPSGAPCANVPGHRKSRRGARYPRGSPSGSSISGRSCDSKTGFTELPIGNFWCGPLAGRGGLMIRQLQTGKWRIPGWDVTDPSISRRRPDSKQSVVRQDSVATEKRARFPVS